MSLAPPNLRLIDPEESGSEFDPENISVENEDESQTSKKLDDKGNVIEIQYPDGSIAISLDGSPLEASEKKKDSGWFDNLVDEIPEGELSTISENLLRDIETDLESRKDWIDDRAQGIKLLGLRIEVPGVSSGADGAPIEGMSKVRHPLFLEAVLRFQANARSELLPTDGPLKIREDNNNADLSSDQLANDLENDLNHYLTSTAHEYYPDTDRMLLMLGFGGTAFKKVYFCPLRSRPVSESVDANDLIVNNSATDLNNAKRITHRITMRQSTMKRMQILGIYKEVDLGTPNQVQQDAEQREKSEQQGIKIDNYRQEDRDREIYECYCELDLIGFEHKLKGKITGLEIPYRVTLDVSSRKVLSVVRNFDESTEKLPEPKQQFVKYTFVPGFGFYDIGLLHILGNMTNAITAALRELLDAGMFANFPGWLMSDAGGRQNTNIFRVPPGGGVQVKTGGLPLNQVISPLPYKDPSPALMTLVDNIAQTGMRLGGTAEQAVGEGKQDAPVGTTLALIDQATKVMNSVHKRMHASQAREFDLLVQCFRENPESFWQSNRKPTRKWDQETFIRALDQVTLVPQADPNTASQTQRIMKIIALKQIQAQNPTLYDPIAIDTAALQAIGWSNPQQFMVPPSAQGAPPPEMEKEKNELLIKSKLADSQITLNNAKAKEALSDIGRPDKAGLDPNSDNLKVEALKLKSKDMDFKQQRAAVDDENREKDRETDMQLERMRLEGESIHAEAQSANERGLQANEHNHEKILQANDLMNEHILHAHELMKQKTEKED